MAAILCGVVNTLISSKSHANDAIFPPNALVELASKKLKD